MQKRVVGLLKKSPVARKMYVNKDWPPGMLIFILFKNSADPRGQACCLTAGTFSFLCQRKVLIQ